MDILETTDSVELIGPTVPHYKATIDGYRIPFLELVPVSDSETLFNACVGPFALCAEIGEIKKWLPFVANAMAYAAGYSSHGSDSRERNDYAVKCMTITDRNS